MTNWTKITPTRSPASGRSPKHTIRVRKRGNAAKIIVPMSIWGDAPRKVSVYHDGNGSLAYVAHEAGEFSVWRENSATKQFAMTLPAAFRRGVKDGTHEIDARMDCDADGNPVLVVKLDSFPRDKPAAVKPQSVPLRIGG